MKLILLAITGLMILYYHVTNACLITNCPRGGKRNNGPVISRGLTEFVPPCISCGPQRMGQCFGPAICCGPFGCLFGTSETLHCERNGGFHDSEPCIAGKASCRGDTGRCAFNGICCTQESCHMDPFCNENDHHHHGTNLASIDPLLAMLSPYQSTNYGSSDSANGNSDQN